MNQPDTTDSIVAQLRDGLEQADAGLVVGCSGGLDSTVLVHALASLDRARALGLRVVHVDHGLHPDSARWAAHVERVCAALELPVTVRRADICGHGDGPEAAARRARWQIYRESLPPGDVLALAQHRDDQAETVLLRLLRGAGPTGLAAMPVWSTRHNGLRVWRPLLPLPRSTLLAYAQRHRLHWIEDPSNADPGYARNWLRQRLLPMLRERWPQVDASLAQVADRQRDAMLLEQQVGRRLLAAAASPDPKVLRIPPLLTAPPEARSAALRLWLQPLAIGAARLRRIECELLTARADADSRIELPDRVLRRHDDELHALAPNADQPLQYDLHWDGQAPLPIPGVGTLRLDPAPTSAVHLDVRQRHGGERLRVHPKRPRQALKHLLQEAGLAPWLRARWPVLWLDDDVAGFADLLTGVHLHERLRALGCRLHFDPD